MSIRSMIKGGDATSTAKGAFVAAALLTLAVALPAGAQTPQTAAKAPQAAAFKPTVEPQAMEFLKAVSGRLAAAKSMSFTAVASYEYPSKLGPPIVYSTRFEVAMQRPNKLRVLMPGDGPASEFYYDGKSMMAYAPAQHLVAVADAPPTIAAMLDRAFRTAGIYFPFEDLLVDDPFAAMTRGVIHAFVIGPSTASAGGNTMMVAWASQDVHLQIWFGAEDKLPRRVRAIFREDPLALRHQVDFYDWKLEPSLSAETFSPAKVAGAGRMPFAAPAAPPKGVKPLTQPR